MNDKAPRQTTVLFYVHALSGGGAERVIVRLASGFAQRGHRVLLVIEQEAPEWLSSVGANVCINVLPATAIRQTLALARLIKREAPDATISAISGTNLKHIVAATLAGRQRRAIITYHGFFENEPQAINRLGYLLTPVLSRFAAATVAVSDTLRRHLVGRFKADERHVTTIFNPATPEPPPPFVDAASVASRAPIVLAIGRLVPDKGYMLLIRAFAKVDTPDARLVILGKGPELAALQAEAERLGVAGRVEFPGFVSDTASYLRNARCFALTSYYETFSLALVEALAHGLPVVATDSGGPAEILTSPGLGHIIPLDDVDAAAAAISNALASPGDPVPRIARAMDFSLPIALDNYQALIDKVCTR